jgi:sodium transport system ATP-binding protein
MMIRITDLVKRFGNITAVDHVDFEARKGEIFGLLGENGAGKTTTLRIIATMLKPTSGSVDVDGFDTIKEPEKVRSHIGILFGGETGLYDRLSAAENIAYFGELYDMDRAAIKSRIEYLAEIFGMQDYINRRASKLSRGMKQKVAFARSIVHNPDIMLFDEPTSGLDVSAVREVHQFITNCRSEGKTIVFSSHSMAEVEKLCDRVGIIHKGRLAATGTLDELKRRYENDSLEEIFLELVGAKVGS